MASSSDISTLEEIRTLLSTLTDPNPNITCARLRAKTLLPAFDQYLNNILKKINSQIMKKTKSVILSANETMAIQKGEQAQFRLRIKDQPSKDYRDPYSYSNHLKNDLFIWHRDADHNDYSTRTPFAKRDLIGLKEAWAYTGGYSSSEGQGQYVTYLSDGAKRTVKFSTDNKSTDASPKVKYPPDPEGIEEWEEWEQQEYYSKRCSDWWDLQKNKPPSSMKKWAIRTFVMITDISAIKDDNVWYWVYNIMLQDVDNSVQ